MPENLRKLLDKLIASADFRSRFKMLQEKAALQQLSQNYEAVPPKEINWALLHASLLALSVATRDRHLSQKICALVYQISGENQLIRYAIQSITSRLGNFPTIEFSQAFSGDKITNLFSGEEDALVGFDPALLASISDERDAAAYPIGEVTRYFTLDQRRVVEALESKSVISFSAPTSFGKSFVVRLFIFNKYVQSQIKKTLIILPTKALIDDFFKDLVSAKAEYNLDYQIITHTRSLSDIPERVIFVLTQERLSYIIANQPEIIEAIDLVYCDEAHSVSRGYRGFLLQSTIKQIISLVPRARRVKYIFSSPLISNPDYFRNMFFSHIPIEETAQIRIGLSSVEKTTYIVTHSDKSFRYNLLAEEIENIDFRDRLFPLTGRIPYGNIAEKGKDKKIVKNLRAVINFGDQSKNLLYTQSPREAHKYGLQLARLLPEPIDLPVDLEDFNRYVRDHFDERFGLVELMRKGIGLHYGPMPIGLRRYIVEQFEKGSIRYLICTSTLLEGVNLPAKNIFIFSESRDHSNKHNALSFKNLIGRAGRITFGLSGNVICLGNTVEQYKDLILSSTQDIEPPQNEVLISENRKSKLLSTILEGDLEYLNDQRRRADLEYLIFELFTKDNPQNILSTTALADREITKIIEKIDEIKSSFTISLELMCKNPGIDPRLQNNLYNYLSDRENLEIISECFSIISNPRAISKDKINRLLQLTYNFLNWPYSVNQTELIAGRITQWVHEQTLGNFIAQRIKGFYINNPNPSYMDTIGVALEEIKFLERNISFDAPKYLKCLLDVIFATGHGIQDNAMQEKIENFLFSIESGTSNSITKMLYELGVSRSLAIKIKDLLGDRVNDLNDFQSESIKGFLKSNLSSIAFNELYEHLS